MLRNGSCPFTPIPGLQFPPIRTIRFPSAMADIRQLQRPTSMMDKPTEGALGGSAFRQFVITVDWPNAIAVFERL